VKILACLSGAFSVYLLVIVEQQYSNPKGINLPTEIDLILVSLCAIWFTLFAIFLILLGGKK